MRRQHEFAEIFLLGKGPSLALLGAFGLGLLVVGLLSNLIYGLLTAPAELVAVAWRVIAGAGLLTLAAYGLYRYDQRRKTIHAVVDESRLAPSHRGLVWLLGPGRNEHLLFALEHHAKAGGASHCWLVMQDSPAIRQAFNTVSEYIVEKEMLTQLHPRYIPRPDAESAYAAIRAIFEHEAAKEGLAPRQIIADVTGGTKPLTAGMVLAALTTGRSLEYVESERNEQGQPIPGTLRVVLVDMTFYFSQE